jgi:probable HAF family extracellular repeat protein
MSVGRKGISYAAALLWSPNGAVQDLGTLGGTHAEALAINNLGQVVGNSSLAGNSVYHAFLWTPNVGMQDLGSLDGNSFTSAINNNSEVVGEFRGTVDHAFLWTQAGGMQDLGSLGGYFSRATGINVAVHVVGTSALSDGSVRAFFWTAQDGMKELDLGQTAGSQAFAINDSDQVVGYFVNPQDNQNHAFLWSPTTGIRDLGTLPGTGSFSSALPSTIPETWLELAVCSSLVITGARALSGSMAVPFKSWGRSLFQKSVSQRERRGSIHRARS